MGSGLILLVIVGAWLAVLVPMALRSHDSSALGTVDKFHDAMRVLSRRDGARSRDRGDLVPPPPPPGGGVPAPVPTRRSTRAVAAARRRRVLVGLSGLSVATLLGGVLGPLWLLAPHLLVDLLLGGFLVHLRRIAVGRAEREWRAAMEARPARPARRTQHRSVLIARPAHVAGIPDRMPSRTALLGVPLPARPRHVEEPAAMADAVPAARGAQGGAWLPVPVPAPIYLSAPVARRPAGTRAGADGVSDAERELGIVDQGPALEEILERRRAVNEG